MKKFKWLNRGLILIVLMLMSISSLCFQANAENLSSDESKTLIYEMNSYANLNSEVALSYDEGVDYLGQMVSFAIVNDLENGKLAEQKRNLKIVDKQIETLYPQTYFFEIYDNGTDIISAIEVFNNVLNPTSYKENFNYLSEMMILAKENTIPTLTLGNVYEKERNNKICKLGLDFYTTNFFSGEYKNDGNKICELIENYVIADSERKKPKPQPTPEIPKEKDYSKEDADLLARLLVRECGSDWLPTWVVEATASVVVNRKDSSKFSPNTIKGIIFQAGQYHPAITGTIWSVDTNGNQYQRMYKIAKDILQNGSKTPKNVLFQTQFTQGYGIYATYYDSVLGTTTYFCYG